MGKFDIDVIVKAEDRAVVTITTRDGSTFSFEGNADTLTQEFFDLIKKMGVRPAPTKKEG